MFWGSIRGLLTGLAFASATIVIPGTAYAGVVVKSSGPSAGDYPVGRAVDDDATITLRAGDRITILTDDGTRVMQEPGTFRVGEGATQTRARFSNLKRTRAARRVRTGAVRGAEETPGRDPDLWFVNLSVAGNICLLDLERVRLWRPDAEAAQTYRILDMSSDKDLEVAFVQSVSVRALDPGAMRLREGADYAIFAPSQEDGGARPKVEVRFVTLDPEADYSSPARLAAALHENGCDQQFALLADTLEGAVE